MTDEKTMMVDGGGVGAGGWVGGVRGGWGKQASQPCGWRAVRSGLALGLLFLLYQPFLAQGKARLCARSCSLSARFAGSDASPTAGAVRQGEAPLDGQGLRGHAKCHVATVDDAGPERRRRCPSHRRGEGKSIAEHGPIPTDAHLIPPTSSSSSPSSPPSRRLERHAETLGLSGKPWYAYRKPEPRIFSGASTSAATSTADASAPPKVPFNEEMFRTQYMEWTLQKNAYNPDIAAAMRTNVRKQASLSTVDPTTMQQDPARSSEHVKAASPTPRSPRGPLPCQRSLASRMSTRRHDE